LTQHIRHLTNGPCRHAMLAPDGHAPHAAPCTPHSHNHRTQKQPKPLSAGTTDDTHTMSPVVHSPLTRSHDLQRVSAPPSETHMFAGHASPFPAAAQTAYQAPRDCTRRHGGTRHPRPHAAHDAADRHCPHCAQHARPGCKDCCTYVHIRVACSHPPVAGPRCPADPLPSRSSAWRMRRHSLHGRLTPTLSLSLSKFLEVHSDVIPSEAASARGDSEPDAQGEAC